MSKAVQNSTSGNFRFVRNVVRNYISKNVESETNSNMLPKNINKWFSEMSSKLEESYLAGDTPWQQSGFFGPEEIWIKCRKPIEKCIVSSGTFLDIGCANGYLLECLIEWTRVRGIKITPFGLDISEKLIDLSKQRLPKYKYNFYVGNAFTWISPQKYDYVRTELVYVPEQLKKEYVDRLLKLFLTDKGKLLIAEYRSRRDIEYVPWINTFLENEGFRIDECKSAFCEGKELTRVCVISSIR